MTTETVGPEIGLAERVEEQYVVRLLFKFNADSPEQAVEKMIAELADNGLRNWHYRVENMESGELFFVTGFGEVKTIEDLTGDDDDDEESPDDDSGADD